MELERRLYLDLVISLPNIYTVFSPSKMYVRLKGSRKVNQVFSNLFFFVKKFSSKSILWIKVYFLDYLFYL